MPCCGQTRSQLNLGGQAVSGAKPIATPSPTVMYQYTGKTGMTVVGASGRTYRFSEPGARVPVDAMDVRSMAGVPNLNRL